MGLSIDEAPNVSISTTGMLKRCWDLLGVILVILQLSSHFLSSDVSADSARTRTLPLYSLSTLYWTFKRCVSSSPPSAEDTFLAFLNIHILVDLYFLIDVRVRMLSAKTVISSQAPRTRAQIARANQLRTCWFIIDLLLIFPHGFCWQLWQSRPALQLLNIRQGKRPIFEFFRNREFRKKVFQLFREHRAEKKMIHGFKGLFLGGGSVLVSGGAMPMTRLRWVLSFATVGFRKSANLVTRVFRSWNKYRSLKVYSLVVRWISWIAMSMRAVYISRISEGEDDMDDALPVAVGVMPIGGGAPLAVVGGVASVD